MKRFIDALSSDQHFGHTNIIQYANRPFSSVEEMNEELIRRYNNIVGTSDTCLWCGDAFFTSIEKASEIMKRLNGKKILIVGNHDRGSGSMAGIGFDLVMDECVLNIAGKTVRVKHYPYKGSKQRDERVDERFAERRPLRIKGELLIHGHTHSKNKINQTMIHVGVDAWDYAPATYDQIVDIINTHFNKNHQLEHTLTDDLQLKHDF